MRNFICFLAIFLLLLLILPIPSVATGADGEALFNDKCAACHPKGGNIINPVKTLSKADREGNDIKTAEDIVNIMRNPAPGMIRFSHSDLSDLDAMKIAGYILETF